MLCDPQHPCAAGQSSAPYYYYDAENRMAAAGGSTTYTYDGDGRHMKKMTAGGEVTVLVYDTRGRLVAEYSNIAPGGGTSYLTPDMLGSTREVTGHSGEAKARHDYFPFGEEICASMGPRAPRQGYVAGDSRQKFTGYERDAETGLDYAQARYYSNTQGRFTSTDPVIMTQERLYDPQQINLYGYCRNNPLNFIDPTGMDPVDSNVWVEARGGS